MERRIKTIFILLFISVFALAARMLYIQIYLGNTLSKEALSQQITSQKIDKIRGNIVDRNGISFTNRDILYYIALQPLLLRNKPTDIRNICEVLNLDYNTIFKEVNDKDNIILLDTDENKKNLIIGLHIQGVSVINNLGRYGDSTVARHILGYVSKTDQVGVAGLEKAYNSILNSENTDSVGVAIDAKRDLIKGLGYRINKYSNIKGIFNVKLTLDYHIQKIVEDVMNTNKISGAVVVEDISDGDVIAMSSKPDFDQNNIEEYLHSPQKELFNKSTASYDLGSIFKIIDVAAGLESNVNIDYNFFDPGYIDVGNRQFKSSSYGIGGNGWITLTNAFALSCNSYFIDMGIKIGYKNLVNMAQKFGLGKVTGINEQGVEETPGNLPDVNAHHTDGDTANLSIGQGLVMATPLQAADIAATIANGGIKNKINIVDSIIDHDGNIVKNIKVSKGERIISQATADKIKSLMEDVTTVGTGTKANLSQYGRSR